MLILRWLLAPANSCHLFIPGDTEGIAEFYSPTAKCALLGLMLGSQHLVFSKFTLTVNESNGIIVRVLVPIKATATTLDASESTQMPNAT